MYLELPMFGRNNPFMNLELEILKLFSKKIYICPGCNRKLKEHQKKCVCGATLIWKI